MIIKNENNFDSNGVVRMPMFERVEPSYESRGSLTNVNPAPQVYAVSPMQACNTMMYQPTQNRACYQTNNSAPQEVVSMFCNGICHCIKELNEIVSSNDESALVRIITLLITQDLKLIVRHQRWFYAYNGKIYLMYSSMKNLAPFLRELCENISCYVTNFVCDAGFIESLIKEINQIAPYVEVSYDIGRYIVFNNCILDTATMQAMPFTSGLFATSMVNVNWNPYAFESPVFDSIISMYTQGDEVLAARLKEVLGVCLTNDTVKSIFCFEGITNSGKSFIVNYIISLLNQEAVVSMAPDEFKGNFANVKVFNKSICMCLDMPSTTLDAKSTSMLKQISGGDMIGAEVKFQNGNICFRSRAHLVLGSNFDIVPAYGDIAFRARKVVIPFTHRITDENIQPDELRMMLEPEKEAIVNKLIRAYLSLRANGYVFSGTGMWYDNYVPPVASQMSHEESISAFVRTCCNLTGDSNDYVFTEELYNAYTTYSNMINVHKYTSLDSFAKDFKKSGAYIDKIRKRSELGGNPRYCYTGIRLR